MIELMIISSLVLLISITSSKVLYKFGVPILLIFIALGMLFGSDGIVGINQRGKFNRISYYNVLWWIWN